MYREVVYGPLRLATPFTNRTTSSVLGAPDGSRTDFRTSQWRFWISSRHWQQSILATRVAEGCDMEGSVAWQDYGIGSQIPCSTGSPSNFGAISVQLERKRTERFARKRHQEAVWFGLS